MRDDVQYLAESPLYPLSKYVHELKPELPPEVFRPARSRVLLVPIYIALIATAMLAIAKGWLPWPVVPLVSIAIGICFACLTFVAHEAGHGGVVRNKAGKQLLGWIGFFPFMLSPRLWTVWHDRVHHSTANFPEDPDVYPTLDEYKKNGRVRFFVDAFSLGGRRWRGALSLILGFTVISVIHLLISTSRGWLTRRQRRFAIAETLCMAAAWATLAAVVGFLPFLFVFVLPVLVANTIVMSFILTNHNLSPMVPINDPLISGLSVTTPKWIDWLTLNFGYHVEHHLFPSMSSRHAPLVRDHIRNKWPERYQSMSLVAAVRQLHRTARVYKDAITLVDPSTGQEFPTLLPSRAASAVSATAA